MARGGTEAPSVHQIPPNRMARIGTDEDGWVVTGQFKADTYPARVVVEAGMPKECARVIVAHELGHFIFHSQMGCPNGHPGSALEEGLCQLIAYVETCRALAAAEASVVGAIDGQTTSVESEGGTIALHDRLLLWTQLWMLETRPDETYGVGFRKCYDAWLRSQLPLPLFLQKTAQARPPLNGNTRGVIKPL